MNHTYYSAMNVISPSTPTVSIHPFIKFQTDHGDVNHAQPVVGAPNKFSLDWIYPSLKAFVRLAIHYGNAQNA
jgi:hypothetical protein